MPSKPTILAVRRHPDSQWRQPPRFPLSTRWAERRPTALRLTRICTGLPQPNYENERKPPCKPIRILTLGSLAPPMQPYLPTPIRTVIAWGVNIRTRTLTKPMKIPLPQTTTCLRTTMLRTNCCTSTVPARTSRKRRMPLCFPTSRKRSGSQGFRYDFSAKTGSSGQSRPWRCWRAFRTAACRKTRFGRRLRPSDRRLRTMTSRWKSATSGMGLRSRCTASSPAG